ncbi:MAG: GtrA family protein, partial [Actinobacteria bacterium]|nr:GtrA family protein [Actinomycetota bacterium]
MTTQTNATASTPRLLPQLIKFGAVGAVGFGVNLVVFNVMLLIVLRNVQHATIYSTIIATVIAILTNWIGNRYWAFSGQRQQNAAREGVEFFVVSLATGTGLPLLCVWVSHYLLGLANPVADNISANVVGLALGMPTAGAMDRVGLALANALAGNPANTAGLEIGVMGPDLLVEAESVRIALTGPLSPALIEGDSPPKPLESDRSHLLKRGQILRVGMVEGSSTAYLAVAGGFTIAPFMGSLSTYARAGIGGFEGRKLAADDVLPLKLDSAPAGDERKLAGPFDYGSGPIRVIWGPQDDYFSEAGRQTFVTSEYTVSKEADRMGIRFE